MNTITAIENRRSTRKFSGNDIDQNTIRNILKAGINAPSPKNNQPWKFFVIKESKQQLIKVIEKGIEDIKSSFGLLLDAKNFLYSAETTLKIMKDAPVIIFVINTENKQDYGKTLVKKYVEMANILSIGAAVENMLLASHEYGIGSLWIGDIYYTVREIGEWLQTDRQIAAAIALGYPDEDPSPKKRKELNELVEWK
ncbi:MAG: nitroreductase family protein [Treponema sp.]|nr:nitroreductase family protein [Treponema sp.]